MIENNAKKVDNVCHRALGKIFQVAAAEKKQQQNVEKTAGFRFFKVSLLPLGALMASESLSLVFSH
jgi:hypothetical protein